MVKSPVHVVYLSYDGLTDPLGQSQIMPYIGGLKEYRFTVISFEKKERYRMQGSEIQSWCNSNFVKWVPLTYHKWPPVLSTVYDLIVLWVTVKRLYREDKFKVVHCRSYITSLVGLRSQKKWGIKFIFDMRGFWADERVEGKIWNLKNPLFASVYNYFKRKEKQFLLEADHVVSLTNNAEKEIRKWGIKAPISVIPTCVDIDLFNINTVPREQRTQLMQTLGIKPSDFILLYLGSWGTWYETAHMLDFFKSLKARRSNAKFLIVSPDEVTLNDYELRVDVAVCRATREEVPVYISLANAAICFIQPSFSKKASSATKLSEIFAMNVPVIVNGGWGDVENICPEKTLIHAFTQVEYARAIDGLDSPQEHLRGTYVSVVEGVNRYAKVYNQLFEKQIH